MPVSTAIIEAGRRIREAPAWRPAFPRPDVARVWPRVAFRAPLDRPEPLLRLLRPQREKGKLGSTHRHGHGLREARVEPKLQRNDRCVRRDQDPGDG